MAKRIDTYEDGADGARTARVVTVVLLYGLAAIQLYLLIASPTDGFPRQLLNKLNGMGGGLAFVIPLFFVWVATLLVMSLRGRKINVWKTIPDGMMFLLLLTAVQVFRHDGLMKISQLRTYTDVLAKAAGGMKPEDRMVVGQYGGGGMLGEILAYPLVSMLSAGGGFIATLLLAVLCQTANGHIPALVQYVRGSVESRSERPQKPENLGHPEVVREQPARGRRRKPVNETVESPTEPIDMFDPKADDLYPVKNSGPARLRKTVGSRTAQSGVTDRKRVDDIRTATSRNVAPLGKGTRGRREPDRNPFETAESVQDKNRKRGEKEPNAFDSAVDVRGRKPAQGRKPMEGERRPSAERPGTGERPRPADPARANAAERPRVSEAERPKKAERTQETEGKRKEPVASAAASTRDRSTVTGRVSVGPRTVTKVDAKKPVRSEPRPTPKKASEPENKDYTIKPEESYVLTSDTTEEAPKPVTKLKRVDRKAEDPNATPYYYPPIDLLEPGMEINADYRDSDMAKARHLEETLREFGIQSKLTGIAHGPTVTRFELMPAPGVKVSRITSLADDIAMHLAAMSVRIEAPIPGKSAVGVEIPNEKIETVRLRDVLESSEARKMTSKIAVALGKDNAGRHIIADIAKMPHVLIAGQTGSGKSVCINSIITSILYRSSPDEVRMLLIDPKVVELSVYNDIPHLICPVVTDPKKAASALNWAVAEMTQRYAKFAERGVRNIKGYNANLPEGEKPMTQMVIIIDELADLMMVASNEVEDSICRIAQLARACGMHLVIATQRPSVNVITGLIKANIPTRIAFSVASQIDSRTMIDRGGAEKLLGNGDMLFLANGENKTLRVQGCWVSDEEINAIVDYIKKDSKANYDEDMMDKMNKETRSDAENEESDAEYDELLPEAVEIVVEAGQASVSMLQRRMRVGYARAGRLIDEMERRGIVSEAAGAKPRTVLIRREDLATLFE